MEFYFKSTVKKMTTKKTRINIKQYGRGQDRDAQIREIKIDGFMTTINNDNAII